MGQCVQMSRPQCHFSNKQYLMHKIDEHNDQHQTSSQTGGRCQAIGVLGLQDQPPWASSKRVWVFNENVQL